jgi:hypothetical protein
MWVYDVDPEEYEQRLDELAAAGYKLDQGRVP